ncbi:peroxiredoxin-like family protein [Noviherbaspirillum saxi]|uniref:AhpC/TSA family protein n=1 Tax=Noviherbaspirillum saxi TaxID=2320863 RepID=A0A3A3GAJ4_9BURK|nr:peroxiredoxin-like family protein [Noviherbaspirillum saxi]RJF99195.1 AhpC/TSA family protein [Noviherbaspirillum saxi]
MKLNSGDRVPNVSATTIHGKTVGIPDPASRYVHLQFRRFAGCPVCNFHLLGLRRRYSEIEAAGIHEIVVFHSSREEMLKYQAQLPFDCVADPTKKFYREFGVGTSRFAPLHPSVLWSGLRGILATGKFYNKAENGVFGLPADFLIAPDGTITASHYGKHADDNWGADELLRLADRGR